MASLKLMNEYVKKGIRDERRAEHPRRMEVKCYFPCS